MPKSATRQDAVWVIRRLKEQGFEALLAGGCVRDLLLGLEPVDYDVATNATPEQIQTTFKRVLMIGAKFGVAMVVHEKRMIEVATFRSDVSYSDGRRPDKVVFSNAEADAQRRDFTINGMFMDPVADTVIDYVAGKRDLSDRLVRAIGDPAERFSEDYLRMLRAVRFAAQLDFVIEPATARAISEHAEKIADISGERIREELEKMLSRPTGHEAMVLLHRLGLAQCIFGEDIANEFGWRAAMDCLKQVAPHRDFLLSLSAVLSGADVKRVAALTRRWGASNAQRESLLWLAEHVNDWPAITATTLPDFKRLMARGEDWDRILKLWRAEEIRLSGTPTQNDRIVERANAIDPSHVSPPPLVTGDDLKQFGLTEGPRLGRVLHQLYDMQLDEQIATRQQALEAARTMVS